VSLFVVARTDQGEWITTQLMTEIWERKQNKGKPSESLVSTGSSNAAVRVELPHALRYAVKNTTSVGLHTFLFVCLFLIAKYRGYYYVQKKITAFPLQRTVS
jgi:hypothetical protein